MAYADPEDDIVHISAPGLGRSIAEVNMGREKMPDIYEVIRAGLAKHEDMGIVEYMMQGEAVPFYEEHFTYKGECYIITHFKELIDRCSNPTLTRGLLAEVIIHGLTGLESRHLNGGH